MLRQAFRDLAVWFFANRSLQPLRLRLARWLEPFWPAYSLATIEAAATAESCATDARDPPSRDDVIVWRRLDLPFDIDPVSGAPFHRGRRPVHDDAQGPAGGLPVVSDLVSHVFPRRIAREPALVLWSGDPGLEAFVGEALTRFFALDEMGVPPDVLLLVGQGMGRRTFFQDALIDQLFQPRPVELMRERRLVSVETLHELRVPPCSPRLLRRVAARVAEVYGPWDADGGAVFLCEGGAARAPRLLERIERHAPPLAAQALRIIDPARTSLRDTVRALAAAEVVCAPDTGEGALLALAPSRRRRFYELATPGGGQGPSAALLAAIGENRTVVPAR